MPLKVNSGLIGMSLAMLSIAIAICMHCYKLELYECDVQTQSIRNFRTWF